MNRNLLNVKFVRIKVHIYAQIERQVKLVILDRVLRTMQYNAMKLLSSESHRPIYVSCLVALASGLEYN